MSTNRLMFGFHAITSRMRQNPASVKEIFLDSGRRDPRARDLATLAENSGVKLISCDSSRLEGMAQGARHQGVAASIDPTRSHIDVEDVLDTLAEPALLLVLRRKRGATLMLSSWMGPSRGCWGQKGKGCGA